MKIIIMRNTSDHGFEIGNHAILIPGTDDEFKAEKDGKTWWVNREDYVILDK
jgi:hypothetical protein